MSSTVKQLPAQANIECYAGDDFLVKINFQVEDESGAFVPADFSGCSAKMQIKRRSRPSEALINLTSPSSGLSFPSSSSLQISITKAQTAILASLDLTYDLEITDTLLKVRTYLYGTFEARKQITT